MLEMLVGSFVLTGSVCIIDGDMFRQCREVPAIQFGNKYECNRRLETILDDFPHVPPGRLGFYNEDRLRLQVRCHPRGAAA